MYGNAVCSVVSISSSRLTAYFIQVESHVPTAVIKNSVGKKGILSYKSRLPRPSSFQRSQVRNLK